MFFELWKNITSYLGQEHNHITMAQARKEMSKNVVNYKVEQNVRDYFYNLDYILNSSILFSSSFSLEYQKKKKVFILSLFPKDSFTEYKILSWCFFIFFSEFTFRTLKILFWLPVLLLRGLLWFNFYLFEVILSCFSFKIFLSLVLCLTVYLDVLFIFGLPEA